MEFEDQYQDQNQNDSQDNHQYQERPKKYDKRPLWQWVIVYILAAAIVFGVVYYIFFYH